MDKLFRIGIDIGGTKVNMGIIREDGAVMDSSMIYSKEQDSAQQLVHAICTNVEECLQRNHLKMDDVHHIGVGIPGTADSNRGFVCYSSNLFGKDVPLASAFRQYWGRDVTIMQDSWAAAWAEYQFGQSKRWDSMLCLTIGTGIGCGVIIRGKVYGGAMNTAGEIGHTSIVPNGRLCSCGRKGCLESYTSGTAMLEQAMERFPAKMEQCGQSTEGLFRLAHNGDKDALALIDESVDKLAYGLAAMINILSINVIAISGGICIHRNLIIAPLADRIQAYGYPAWAEKNKLVVLQAKLGSFAPMVGAAFLTRDCIL